MKYKVMVVDSEDKIEPLLNEMDEKGWEFNSLETEYTTYIVIFKQKEQVYPYPYNNPYNNHGCHCPCSIQNGGGA